MDAAFNKFTSLTEEGILNYCEGGAEAKINETFASCSKACGDFQKSWANISHFIAQMEDQALPFLESAGNMLPQLEGFIVAFAPDVADRVMGVANETLKLAANMTRSIIPVFADTLELNEAVLEKGMNCEMPAVVPEQPSGAPH